MKRTQYRDLYREIRRTLGRFLSIFFIVALGTAFYAGIRSSEPDMKLSADRYYDVSRLMDIRVISTLGLTDEDVEALRAVSGVETAEPSYSAEAFAVCGEERAVMQIFSATEDVNLMTVKKGRMPESAEECFLDEQFMENYGLKIGDTLQLADPDGNDPEALHKAEYTICGCGTWSWYLTFRRGTASIGSGSADAFVVLDPEAFTADYYSTVYVRAAGAEELNSFSDAYGDTIDDVKDNIKEIAGERSEIRYEKLKADAEEQLADAKEQVADAEQELEDAHDKLTDGEKKYRDSMSSYQSGKSQYQSGLKEYRSSKAKLNQSRSKLDQAKAELEAGEKELAAAEEQIAASEKQLQEEEAALAAGEAQVKAGLQQIAAALAEVNAAIAAAGGGDPEDGSSADLAALLRQKQELEAQQQALETQQAELAAGRQKLESARQELEAGKAVLKDKKAELEKGRAEYESGKKQLDQGSTELAAGKRKLDSSGAQLSSAGRQLADARKELDKGWSEYNDAKKDAERQINEAKQEIADGEKELEDLKEGEWYVLGRDSVQSYVEYGMDSDRIGNIGRVFPAIFFLVAALIALTSMTRMIEEERMMIGTMKSLGYGGRSIAAKYIWYALAATLSGSLFGVLTGSKLLPYVILTAYGMLYQNVPYMVLSYHPLLCVISAVLAVGSTLIAVIAASYKELLSTPAALMRPPAPKNGSRIMLERIPFIWERLNFSMKSTFRNLFRYKKRFFMTIFGIGGCMAVLMVSYGLHDSIQTIVDNQYQTIWTYSADCSIEVPENESDQKKMLSEIMEDRKEISEGLFCRVEVTDAKEDNSDVTKEIRVCVVPETDTWTDFLNLHERVTGKACALQDDGIILTEKMAGMLNAGIGDRILIEVEENDFRPVRIAAISENYIYHYAYMTPAGYEALYGKPAEYNHLFLRFRENTSAGAQTDISKTLMDRDDVQGITLISELQSSVNDMMNALNLVVWVLVISAALLVFVVIFNLNNINISERRRELASLKVLGFFDSEVAGYVYRENAILTVMGILLGLVMGSGLHQYVIRTLEVDIMMFGRDLTLKSYLSASLLTAVFAVLVNLAMLRTLKKIDMVESMKSVE
ncbi:MAG: FtsX-like permease family protein [Firmicutes bacterium]|nr:FtsX-like permease family protein [Bacillota bacterium]